MTIEFEIVKHGFNGKIVSYAVPKGRRDPYLDKLRDQPIDFSLMAYFLHRMRQLGRPLKVVDVGANVGTISLPLAAIGCDVLAVEAEALNFGCLLMAASANEFPGFLPVHLAAHSEPSIVFIEGNSAWSQVKRSSEAGAPVFSLPLHYIMEIYGFSDADIIKIDIEGSELAALTGIERITDSNTTIDIIYESNSHTCNESGYTPQALAARLEGLGFRLYSFVEDHLMEYDSQKPQAYVVSDNLATRRPQSEIDFLPIKPFSFEFAELEIRKAANRDNPHQYRHAIRQQPFCTDAFLNSAAWRDALNVAMKRN